MAKTPQEKDKNLPEKVRDYIRSHRKFLEAKGSEPLSETLETREQIPRETQERMTAEDCCQLLRAMAHLEPKRVISRNYFRNHSGMKESTWNRHFGTFQEFKRQAGIVLSRGQHRLEKELARHASADAYRKISEERRNYGNKYDKPSDGRWKTLLVVTDVHDIECDRFALRVLLDTAHRLSHVITGVVFGGDLFDLPEFGRYTQDPRGWDVVGRVKFNHDEVLRPLRESLPDAQMDIVEGNHEARLLRHLGDATPALKVILDELHNFTVPRLLGLDEFEINYVANGDLSARSFTERDHKKELARNWKVYHDCFIVHHFPQGRQKGMPGCNGHHHSHVVWSASSPVYGAYEWHQLGCMHIRKANYTDGEKWSNGFTLVHIDTETKATQFEYVTVGETFCLSAGKFYERD